MRGRGQTRLRFLFVQIAPIINDAVELVRGACARKNVALHVDIDQDLTPVPIDSTAVLQVLLNVLTNAIDASPDKGGSVAIRVSVDDTCEHMHITIVDNGCGIDKEMREAVFRAFHSTKGQRGTGLGLAVAKKVVLEHGGTIGLYEVASGGTRCEITLPLDRDSDPGDTHGAPTLAQSNLF